MGWPELLEFMSRSHDKQLREQALKHSKGAQGAGARAAAAGGLSHLATGMGAASMCVTTPSPPQQHSVSSHLEKGLTKT